MQSEFRINLLKSETFMTYSHFSVFPVGVSLIKMLRILSNSQHSDLYPSIFFFFFKVGDLFLPLGKNFPPQADIGEWIVDLKLR